MSGAVEVQIGDSQNQMYTATSEEDFNYVVSRIPVFHLYSGRSN